MKYKGLNKSDDIEGQSNRNEIKYSRISESYPPDTLNNYRYIADVHQALQGIDFNEIDQQKDIKARHIKSRSDVQQLETLHSEWFPIRYDKEFFDNLLSQKCLNLILELDLSRFGKGTYIIGAIIYAKRSTKWREMKFQFKKIFDDSYCYYIQTIGVINEFRKCGFASYLIDYVKQEAIKNQKIKYVSLHMVVYNKSGERFYLKNGFKKLETLKEFYNIENKDYDSYLFCYYLNGCEPPVSFLQCFKQLFSIFKSKRNYLEPDDIKII